MDKKFKQIGNFKQFLKEQKQKKLNEERISLEVEWWDACIVEVMEKLKEQCAGFLNYESLVKYAKSKAQILRRPDSGGDEWLLLQHIKDLIFTLHGDSLVFDNRCNWEEEDSAEVQAKGLVVGELANTILDKVIDTIKTPDDPTPGVTQISLTDKEPRTLVPMTPVVPDGEEDYMDDLPFEHKKVKPVKTFSDYTKALNETVAMIDCESEEECINYTLDMVKKMVGSLDANEIAIMAYHTAPTKVKTDLVLGMLKGIVYDYISNQKGQVKIVGIGDPKDVKENVPKEVFDQGLDILCGDIADKILGRLAEENGVGYEGV